MAKNLSIMVLISTVLTLTACGGGGQQATGQLRHLDSPSYSTISELTQASTLVVHGVIGEHLGSFTIADESGDDPVYAHDVVHVTVDEVIGQIPNEQGEISTGSTILVGSFGVTVEAAHAMPELVEQVRAFSTGLSPGDTAILFLAPFEFSETTRGWVTVGSDFGILRSVDTQGDYRSAAPMGNLRDRTYRLAEVTDGVRHAGIGTAREDTTTPDSQPPLTEGQAPTTLTPPSG